jgi:annexin D
LRPNSDSLFQFLVALVNAYRYEGPEVNTRLAHSDAKILHEKTHHKKYSDDEIIRILTTRSKAQLQATFNHYNNEFGHPTNKVLAYLMKLLIIESSLRNCALHQG